MKEKGFRSRVPSRSRVGAREKRRPRPQIGLPYGREGKKGEGKARKIAASGIRKENKEPRDAGEE